MKVLAIDSASATMSVGLAEDGVFVAEMTSTGLRNHAIRLMPAIEHILSSVGWHPQQIDRVAVAKGPGSYTGIRMGVTIAKTFAWSVGAELVGVSSLQALALNVKHRNTFICPVFDARRDHIYTGLYKHGQPVIKDRYTPVQSWLMALKNEVDDEPILFIGESAPAFQESIAKTLSTDVLFSSQNENIPHAGTLAMEAIHEVPSEIHTFTPEYLKLAEAEEKWQQRTQ
ncbi:tRNA (adenosine(37)-N6)-threonylcarbamoyltransferase complex dimerization subunit type 1 TsaB [Bacillaceae bacterium SIJ1]|uniref:tRNA (adenosine(37)-N6)-threonylcarbamoyltransferase complex dimerization subunit type 1 TsaB n=1 Tax=Litoribacterium kuwaitense TaxID=1398745 RepID=UPI0013EC6B4F|nr:tRNA (adenosine(37)-N6)-threonylcarbamoyltransferase complex dimerization subunit type 1 TsaB [Litoribacterium kuwaitense]NGP46548.1 tRNA (adenosine(37)-N6)-threonylcarbamoyltransferase complex dimerization subunit type 1 TsaB [Litoribacterium kuwaitense]